MNWLVASRNYIGIHQAQRQHEWKGVGGLEGVHDQVGSRVGILGYGSIGRQSE